MQLIASASMVYLVLLLELDLEDSKGAYQVFSRASVEVVWLSQSDKLLWKWLK